MARRSFRMRKIFLPFTTSDTQQKQAMSNFALEVAASGDAVTTPSVGSPVRSMATPWTRTEQAIRTFIHKQRTLPAELLGLGGALEHLFLFLACSCASRSARCSPPSSGALRSTPLLTLRLFESCRRSFRFLLLNGLSFTVFGAVIHRYHAAVVASRVFGLC